MVAGAEVVGAAVSNGRGSSVTPTFCRAGLMGAAVVVSGATVLVTGTEVLGAGAAAVVVVGAAVVVTGTPVVAGAAVLVTSAEVTGTGVTVVVAGAAVLVAGAAVVVTGAAVEVTADVVVGATVTVTGAAVLVMGAVVLVLGAALLVAGSVDTAAAGAGAGAAHVRKVGGITVTTGHKARCQSDSSEWAQNCTMYMRLWQAQQANADDMLVQIPAHASYMRAMQSSRTWCCCVAQADWAQGRAGAQGERDALRALG